MATILIADDDEGMRMLLSMSLEMAGHHVLVAVNGIEGIALARKHNPDLLVVDANMPPLDGPQAIAQLRAEGMELPAILITADTQESFAVPIDKNTRFLSKPFSPPRLMTFVSQVLFEYAGNN